MLTLDEAIKHCHEKARELKADTELFKRVKATSEKIKDCEECANEHEQLAEWLTELKERREADKWIPVSERLPEEKLFNPSGSDFGFDFEEVLCTTIWGDVRAYKFGKPMGHDKPHFWLGGGIMDEYVIAWQYKPEPYQKGGKE